MIVQVMAFVLGNAAIVMATGRLSRAITIGTPSVDLLLFLLLRLTLISAVVLISGWIGILTPSGLGSLATLAILSLWAGRVRPNLRRFSFPISADAVHMLLAVLLLRLLAQVWFFSPYLADPLSYHLPKVAEWVRAGRLTLELGVDTHATLPAGFELLETWWVVFFHHDVLIEMAGVEFLILSFAAVYALGDHLGLRGRGAVVAGALYILTPGVYLQSTSCLNDGAIAAMVLALFALVAWRVSPSILLMALGLGVGIKPTCGYALPGLALLMFWSRSRPARSPEEPLLAWSVGVLGLAVGSFWYLRNWAVFGSPFYPVGTSVAEGWIQVGPRGSSLFSNFVSMIRMTFQIPPISFTPLLTRMTGWGPVAIVCGLPSLVVALSTRSEFRRLALATAVSVLSVFLLVLHDDWSTRFVLFAAALVCLGIPACAERYPLMLLPVGIACVFEFMCTFLPRELPLESARTLAHQDWRERSARELFRLDVGNHDVAYFGMNDGLPYLCYGPNFSYRVLYLRGASADGIVTEMIQKRVQYLYAVPSTTEQDTILRECLRRNLIRFVSPHCYVLQ